MLPRDYTTSKINTLITRSARKKSTPLIIGSSVTLVAKQQGCFSQRNQQLIGVQSKATPETTTALVHSSVCTTHNHPPFLQPLTFAQHPIHFCPRRFQATPTPHNLSRSLYLTHNMRSQRAPFSSTNPGYEPGASVLVVATEHSP
ncbi:unnamed protein product, partial [Ectocarpus sp. 8 AP-2014]